MREVLGVTKAEATSDRYHSGRSSVAAAAAALFVMVDALAWSRMRHELVAAKLGLSVDRSTPPV